MPVIRINANGDTPRLHRSPAPAHRLLEQTRHVPGPVIIMTHGYKYMPGHPLCCPHAGIFATGATGLAESRSRWPAAMGLDGHGGGLGIAFGWDARGTLWQAQRRARAAGRALADVIGTLRRLNPDRPVHLISHSMGVELAFEALHHLPGKALDRIVSMTGAAFRSRAEAALATPAGRQVEFINVTSRENDLFDFLFERLIAPPRRGDRAIGDRICANNAVTVQIDCVDTRDHIARLGFELGDRSRRVCHWSSYMRPGALWFYAALMRDPGRYPLDLIRRGLPAESDRRWSRLAAVGPLAVPLPSTQKAS